jgi:hypothetical protein
MNSPEKLARTVEAFLADARTAVVLEEGVLAFDFATARYSLSTEHGKCLLHLWSPARNAVRRVLEAEAKNGSLRLSVLRFGQSKPLRLEICRDRDQRSPSQRRAARSAYQARLRALLERRYAGWTIEQLTSEMDLGRSFSPVYTRGLLKQGTRAFALLGVNAEESQAAIDGAVTFGILWFDYCRERQAGRCHVEGLKLIVPRGAAEVARQRIAHLNRELAKWQLYCFDEREGAFEELDTADHGNIGTRLVQCPDEAAARERFAISIGRVLEIVPHAEVAVLSASEIALRLHGLEIARARMEPEAGSFRLCEQIVYGTGANETVLTEDNVVHFTELLRQASAIRRPHGEHTHPLWRMVPERWLESRVVKDVRAIDDRLDPRLVYSQVPAFAASDRAMIDVLGITGDGRLAILELKADEDIHLPLQGIDYWTRVEWHRARGEFERFGYFPDHRIATQPPILLLVAPALRVHPATDTLLRYIAREIDISLVGIDERWREELKVIFRKRRPFL